MSFPSGMVSSVFSIALPHAIIWHRVSLQHHGENSAVSFTPHVRVCIVAVAVYVYFQRVGLFLPGVVFASSPQAGSEPARSEINKRIPSI